MAGASLVFDILARDKASAALSKIGGEVDKTHSRFAKLGGALGTAAKAGALAAGAAGIGAVAAVLKTGYGEVSDYQKGLAQLQQGLKTTHNAAGISAKGMENLASKIQGYSGQTDDSIVATEQLLLTFTNIRNEAGKNNDVFTQTTKIAADMAARLGGDASTQAVRLGKALNDPVKGITALTKVGVSFDDGQKKQIKTLVAHGKTLQAQKVILAELNKEFGGSAKAVGNTLPGMVDKAKRHFEDFSQTLVTKAAPVLLQVANFVIHNVFPALNQLGQQIAQRLTPTINMLGSLLSQHLVPAFKAVASFVQVTILPILRAVAQFVLDKLYPAIGKVLVAALDGLRSAFRRISGAVQAHRAQLAALGNFIRKVAEIALKVLVPVLSVTLKVAFRILGTAISAVITIIADFVSAIRGTVHFAQTAAGGIKTAFNAVVDFFSGMQARLNRITAGMWDGIKDAFRSAINFVIDGWNSLHFTLPKIHIPHVGSFGGESFGTPHIPRLAAGGIVNRPTVALIGEAGPEAVVPLRRGGVGGTVINITTGPMTREGARELDKVLRRLHRETGGALGYAG